MASASLRKIVILGVGAMVIGLGAYWFVPKVLFTAGIILWVNEDAREASAAVERMEQHTHEQLTSALKACMTLVAKLESLTYRSHPYIDPPQIPAAIEALGIDPNFIRVNEWGCGIHMHKGVGKGIGYSFTRDGEGDWGATWFNHYRSWDSNEIQIAQQDEDGA